VAQDEKSALDALNAQIAEASNAAAVSRQQASATISASAPGAKKIWWSVEDAMTISSVVLAFGLIITIVAAWLVRSGISHNAVLRVFGTILILVFAVFLVVAGYDDKQIAPVLGLLGTVAGYLLGRYERGDAERAAPERDRDEIEPDRRD
jgi:hypothetical protein